jgi:hypothetical protein
MLSGMLSGHATKAKRKQGPVPEMIKGRYACRTTMARVWQGSTDGRLKTAKNRPFSRERNRVSSSEQGRRLVQI